MKFKNEIMFMSLIVVMLFAVSSVCAVDSEIQDIGAHNSTDTVGEVNDVDLKMDNADEMLANTNDFEDLNYTINGNSSKTYVELEKDYMGPFDGSNGVQINKADLVIDGKGHTINCTGQNSRIFNVQVNGIVLKNIKFVGGSSDFGGAIYTNGNLTIINCTFIDNQATGTTDNHDGGGAVFGDNVKMSIYNCTFMNNHASKNGGAIAAAGDAPDNYEIFNCTFIGNVANNWGGAFYSNAAEHMGNIINSTFINNRASAGDAVYNYGYYGAIDRCIFVNNTANSMICADYANEMIVINSIIVNNYGDNLISVPNGLIISNNNWWGTTDDDDEAPVISGNTQENYYILNMTVDDDSADITLNNLYDRGSITTYDNYALPSIILTVGAKNIEVNDSVVLGTDGKATIEHAPAGQYEITVEYNGIKLTRDVKPTFKWLRNQIDSGGSEFSLEQDCIYDSAKDYALTKGIEFAKDMTIDGQGHVIDAKESSNIFYFDDDTNSYSLTLKNIIFANAVGVDGAAVYFKGNKLEIINCTFINNKVDSQGDAVYVANALSNANIITGSLFTENNGSSSILFINLDSNANLIVNNSIFMKNSASRNIIATGKVFAEYNWWGNTYENNEDISKTEGVNVTNWLFLKIDAVAAMNGNATLSLNNVYDGGEISTYNEYALQPLTFSLGGLNATPSVPTITLGDDGRANYQFRMDRAVAALNAGNDDVTTSAQLEYSVVDDGSFRALNEIIFFSDEAAVIELTHDYVYCDSDTITEGIVIPRKITINGNGHTIDAKGKTRIFWIPEGVPHVTINNISFTNAKADHGSVIVINKDSSYFSISNCNFTDNNATNYGGVIDCVGDFSTIENCNFINNRAVNNAGVIRYYHDTRAYIKNSNFINNRVADGSKGGGVIYVDCGAVEIDKSTFINNVANDKPGSVIYTLKSATITNSIFLNNPGAYSIYGPSGVELTNNWFGSTSDNYNLLVNDTVSGLYPAVTLNNWLYLDIKFLDDYAFISLNDAYVKSDNSTEALSNYNLPEITLNVSSTTLDLSTDKVTLDSNGRAIVYYTKNSDDARLTVSNEYISLTEDFVIRDFDILQWLVDANDVIELGRDYAYTAEDSITGGIAVKRNVTIDGKGHTIDAKGMTQIFNIQALNVTLKNIIFANGNSSNDGGAVCISSDGGICNIENCTFLNNTAEGKGGAIYINAINSEFSLYDSSFTGNKAKNDGALYIETDNTVTAIDKCLFKGNEAASDSYENNGNAIVWKSINDNAVSVVKNSIFLENGHQKDNGMYAFLWLSGNVNIDYNWWGTTAQNPETFNSSFVGGGITPDVWLFINSSVNPKKILYNETSKITYCLQAHNGTGTTDFDNSKLPYIDFDITCDKGVLDKDKVSLNEEITFRANDLGNALVDIYCNGIAYETCIYGPYMISRSNDSFIIYANQSLSKDVFINTANGDYANVTITCNDSSLIRLDGDCDVRAKTAEGTAKLTFSYDGSYPEYPFAEELEVIVKVVKVPLNITVRNPEIKEIILNVYDTLDLDIAFEIDEIHKGYASPFDAMGVEYDSNIISFTYDKGIMPENGSYYPTGHIIAKGGGTTDLTIYITSDKFTYENYTIKITVNKIPTAITVDCRDSFKVDDTYNVNAAFFANETQSTATLIYQSSDNNVIQFISDAGDFNATGNGTAVLTVRFAGNSTHENSSKTITVTVSKYETAINITSDREISLQIDDKSQIEATLNPNVVDLEYSSNDERVATVENGLITAVGNGTATITIRYPGDRKYEGSQDTITVIVSKIPTQITADDKILNSTDEGIEIGADINVEGGFALDYSSSNDSVVTVSADGKLTAVEGGQAQVTITYAETERYLSSNKTITVTVKKLETKIVVGENPVSTRYLETIAINAEVVNVNGTKIDDGTLSFFIADKQISNPFTADRVGQFNITVKYAENTKYKASELNVTVISDKAENTITVSVDDAVYPNVTVKVTATLDDNYTVDINGTLVKVEVVNGKGQNTVALPAGKYYANVTGYTNPLFPGITINDTFTVAQAVSDIKIVVLNDVIHVGDAIRVKAIVPADATGNVTFTITDSRTVDVSGVATFGGLSAGNYTIYAIYHGDNNYKASNEVSAVVTVVKYDLDLSIASGNINYGEELPVKISANANFTGQVLVKIGELNQTVNITNGAGNATFANLTADDYFITAVFTENDVFYAGSANTTATVKGIVVPASRAFKTTVPTNSKSATFSIKLDKDATGKLTVNIDNGKIVKTVFLKDGSASITVDNLDAGKHQIVISYSGDGKFAPITQKTTLTIKEPVKPKASTIVAKKKTFKAKKKVKKYVITLKSEKTLIKKVKVTLKVKGKTYTATTNNKGKATFKIKNLKKKGKYTAVIKFKGNKNYKATSKKVKITVKK